jgi:peptidoglycan LD-endopeptidase LytH
MVQSPHPVMNLPENYMVFDFSDGYDPEEMAHFVKKGGYGVGGYLEKRPQMYLAPQYKNRRNIHMGVDIWAPAGEPVYSPLDGTVLYKANHAEEGNYGGTIVLKHNLSDQNRYIYALYGHLSLKSLNHLSEGQSLKKGAITGWLGDETENGNWPPHLHYQLSWDDPGKADMPGVVAPENFETARAKHPDPRMILGKLY